MSAPVFLVATTELENARTGAMIRVEGSEARHAVSVMRLRAGEEVSLCDGHGLRVRGVVAEAAAPATLIVKACEISREEPEQPQFVLVQALAKGGRDEIAIEAATEVGVGKVVPWQADRSVSRWRGAKVEKGRARWQQVLLAATKQSRRSWLPQLGELVDTGGLVNLVRVATAAGERVLVAHEEATSPLRADLVSGAAAIWLIVGPEGGISEGECARLVDAGAQAVLLGEHVMRTSTAGIVGLAQLRVLRQIENHPARTADPR